MIKLINITYNVYNIVYIIKSWKSTNYKDGRNEEK
jgi:hypothetical protein